MASRILKNNIIYVNVSSNNLLVQMYAIFGVNWIADVCVVHHRILLHLEEMLWKISGGILYCTQRRFNQGRSQPYRPQQSNYYTKNSTRIYSVKFLPSREIADIADLHANFSTDLTFNSNFL